MTSDFRDLKRNGLSECRVQQKIRFSQTGLKDTGLRFQANFKVIGGRLPLTANACTGSQNDWSSRMESRVPDPELARVPDQ